MNFHQCDDLLTNVQIIFQGLYINSDYDQKEQTSRNFIRAIGPFSDLTAIFQLSAGDVPHNVTFLWIDPVGSIAEASEVTFEETAGVRVKNRFSLWTYLKFISVLKIINNLFLFDVIYHEYRMILKVELYLILYI